MGLMSYRRQRPDDDGKCSRQILSATPSEIDSVASLVVANPDNMGRETPGELGLNSRKADDNRRGRPMRLRNPREPPDGRTSSIGRGGLLHAAGCDLQVTRQAECPQRSWEPQGHSSGLPH